MYLKFTTFFVLKKSELICQVKVLKVRFCQVKLLKVRFCVYNIKVSFQIGAFGLRLLVLTPLLFIYSEYVCFFIFQLYLIGV